VLSPAVVERLLRAPDKFEVQRLAITGPRAAVYGRLIEVVSPGSKAAVSGLVPIVRRLVRVIADLTDFARTTKTVSRKAQAVRQALIAAREPAPLLFEELPVACGLPAFAASGEQSERDVEVFVEELRSALRELQRAYPALLDTIEDSLRTGLNLPRDTHALRQELTTRADRLADVAVDPQLKAFLLRARDEDMPRDEWLVSVGTLLGGKPPDSWHDRDVDQMRLTLGHICRRFSSLEAMVIGRAAEPGPGLRVAVAQLGLAELERVVPLRSADLPLIESVRSQIRELAEPRGHRQAGAAGPDPEQERRDRQEEGGEPGAGRRPRRRRG
jgi:hypothetical protein